MKTIEWGNPYTHEEYSRTSYSKEDIKTGVCSAIDCAWCGGLNRRGGLFEYNNTGQTFCSRGCHDTYYDN